MSDISEKFEAEANAYLSHEASDHESINSMKASFVLDIRTVQILDFVAKNSGRSRNYVASAILDEGAYEALVGVCRVLNRDPQEVLNEVLYGESV